MKIVTDNGELKVKGKPLYKNIELLTENGVDLTDVIVVAVDSLSGGGMLVTINDNKYHFTYPMNSTWFDVDINIGDNINCVITRTQLLFVGFRKEEVVEVVVDESTESVDRATKEFMTWHKWTPNLIKQLVDAVDAGDDIDSLANNDIGITKAAIYSQLNKMGYSIKKGIPVKQTKLKDNRWVL